MLSSYGHSSAQLINFWQPVKPKMVMCMIMFRSQSETTLGTMIPQFPVKTAPVFLGIGEFHTALLILNQVLCVQ